MHCCTACLLSPSIFPMTAYVRPVNFHRIILVRFASLSLSCSMRRIPRLNDGNLDAFITALIWMYVAPSFSFI